MKTTEKNKINTESAVQPAGKRGYRFLKRTCDILIALCAGSVLLVPMLIVALLIRLDSRGPALFCQERMGKDGKVFTIYKFRTMAIDAPHELAARNFPNSEAYMTRLGRRRRQHLPADRRPARRH